MRPALLSLFLVVYRVGLSQISFFNMPNPDMLPHTGSGYAEYDRYQSLKGNNAVNASVFRMSFQASPFLEVGFNTWVNPDHPSDPNRVVLLTKWKVPLFEKGNYTLTMSPGNWSSVYFHDTPMKNIFYNFFGLTHQEGPSAYTRLMLGAYGKYIGKFDQSSYGMIAGFEHRFNEKLEFVADYFQGSGEGFGLAMGIVFYALDDGHNLPLYVAYQFDNDSRANDLLLLQVGYFFNAWKSPRKKG